MSEQVVVRAAIAPMHAEARVSSVQVSQELAGHAVEVLASEGDWLRVQSADGYEGWMHRGYVQSAHDARLTFASRRLSLGCVVRTPAGTFALPLGAWISADATVVSGEAIAEEDRPRRFPRDAKAICATAVSAFAGTPYQWGGISPWGADCSGLVQMTFWLHGVLMPRDGWQQAETGRDADSELSGFQPADLLFFTERADRRITHVGIALGASRMVHLALGRGGYAVETLTATDDPYVGALMTRFVSARRVL
ncbi:MAG TPA: SH3 domain-containing C40 family peptidase [Gemmatimonadaceae bacterium]|nr:SH3 domain-containing C40 family peptidase [Gemmatimonadaceae bacterium]